ncbi:MAG: sensor domain-containing diguanylate cyclase [Anaerolineales bacterium]|nr:sensor domain-containing diguanylate cyclase [Anaerolineales bacterium]
MAETQKRAERFAVISEIASALNSTLELNTVLQAVVDGLAHALGVEQTGLALFDEQHTHLTIVAEHAGPGIPSAVGSELPIAGNRSLEYVMSTRAPLYVADAQRDEIMAAVHAVMVQRQVRSILIVPLLFGDQVIGTIGSDSLHEPRAYTAEELWLASTLANLAAVRIHQAQLYSQVQQRTILDGLTQVYNYRGLMEIGAREFERGRRFRRPLSAVFVEIDRFRDFNNRYSHQVGNQVLCAVAQRLRENVREVDLLSRFGGDEFVVLLPETEVKFAVLLGEQLRSAVETMQVLTEHGALGVTVSIGVAGVRDDMQGIADLIEDANRAEHAAKQRGRNRVAVIDSNGADALAPAYAGMALGAGAS